MSREADLSELRTPATVAEAFAHADTMNAALNSKLATYRDNAGRIRPDFAHAYDELVARLALLDRGEIGPQVGDPMPQFLLPDENGHLVSLQTLLTNGPVVVSFNRGHWCPYCKLELRTLAEIYDDVRRLDAQIISIMPERAQFISSSVEQNSLPFPILSDIDLGYSLSLGLVFFVGDAVKELYEGAGVYLDQYQGNQGYLLPMAAKFIVGKDGLVKLRQVNVEFRERMEPSAILTSIERLHKTS